VLHGDRKPLSVFPITTLVLGRRIRIVGECLRGCGGTTLFHYPVVGDLFSNAMSEEQGNTENVNR
jgi:hypothetical protein